MPDFFTRLAERTLARALTVQPVMASMFAPESNLVEQHIFLEVENASVPPWHSSVRTDPQTTFHVGAGELSGGAGQGGESGVEGLVPARRGGEAAQPMSERGETFATTRRVLMRSPQEDATSTQPILPNLHQAGEMPLIVRRGEDGVERLGEPLWSPVGKDRFDGPQPVGGAVWTRTFNTAGDAPVTNPRVPPGNETPLPPLDDAVRTRLIPPDLHQAGEMPINVHRDDGALDGKGGSLLNVVRGTVSPAAGDHSASITRNEVTQPSDSVQTQLISPSNTLLVEHQPGTTPIIKNEATQPSQSSERARFITPPSPTSYEPSQPSKPANASVGAGVSHSSPAYRLETIVATPSGRKVTHNEAHQIGTHNEAHQIGTPAPETSPDAPAPTISVTIGRIEVRATPPSTPTVQPHKQRTASPVMSLDEYLRKPSKGGH